MVVTLLLLALPYTTNTAATAAALPTDQHGDYNGSDLIEWISSHKEGYVHPSLRIGRRIPGDPSSIIGTFVKSDGIPILEGEVIATIPWDCMIGPGDEYQFDIFDSCQAVRNLAAELKLGDESQYKPYVNYLLTQSIEAMPGLWSSAAQQFLHDTILDNGNLPPENDSWYNGAGYTKYLQMCGGYPNDPMERLAYYLTSTRDEDTLMIPIYDMMNHSNDPHKLNTLSYKPKKAGESFVFKASRTIQPNEEIYNCYTRCSVCSLHHRDECETFSFRGTPDIFAHYGFVEEIPHYWWFERRDESHNNKLVETEFCIDVKDDESTVTMDNKLNVRWISSLPTKEDKAFYVYHLGRLGQILKEKKELELQLVQSDNNDESQGGKMTELEWEACWNWHKALVTGLAAAIDSINRISSGEEQPNVITYDSEEEEDDDSSDDDDESGDEL